MKGIKKIVLFIPAEKMASIRESIKLHLPEQNRHFLETYSDQQVIALVLDSIKNFEKVGK